MSPIITLVCVFHCLLELIIQIHLVEVVYMYQQFVFSKGRRQWMLILLQQAMGQQWSTTLQLPQLKRSKRYLVSYGSTKNEGLKQKKVVFCWGYSLLMAVLSCKNNNSFERTYYSCYMLQPSLLYNRPFSVYSFSLDHSHLC